MWEIIGKFTLVCLLSVCITLIVLTGLSLYSRVWLSQYVVTLHIACGLLLAVLAVIHLINRRKKFLKLYTQFNDLIFKNRYPAYCNLDRLLHSFENVTVQNLSNILQLPLTQLTDELRQGNITFSDPNRTLREIVGSNDEKLFSAITIVMQLRFNPNQ